MSNATISKLAAITDAAQFERIATSVLRAAKPSHYANLSHQGVNTDGKTVKSPLDNVGWVRTNDGAMLVAGAHTTEAQSKLEGKWLHDPSTVTPRKKGGKPTQPAGDLVKAIEEIKKLREQYPGLKAILALTCNREEPAQVRVKAEALAHANEITLDVWSASRLAQFLDTHPDGQAIRFDYLGVKPTRLSMQELLRIGRQSLASRPVVTEENALVERHLADLCGHTLLSGPSGMGKTTICLDALSETLRRDQPGIVLEDQTVMCAATLEEALDIELHRYSPTLEPFSGIKALELCSQMQPLLVVVEDINRSENTERLLNKLVNWVLQKVPGTQGVRWRLLCPIWPRFLMAIDKKDEVNKAGLVQIVGLYTDQEARVAVKRRSALLGRPMDDLAASAIATALGNDPLIIGLHDMGIDTPCHDVVSRYVADELERTSLETSLTITDLEDAVRALGLQMLERRNLQPTWRDVQDWLAEGVQLAALRLLLARGRLLRLHKNSRGEVLEARHDRVLYYLLANAVGHQFATAINAPYLSDPYFAEIMGMAASASGLSLEHLRASMDGSPLVAFYALKHSVVGSSDYVTTAANAIEQWVKLERHQGSTYSSRRYWSLVILAEIDSPVVIDLASHFPNSDKRQPYFEARFRNGDFSAGFAWLTEYPFDVSDPGRQDLVDRVHHKYGRDLVNAVSTALEMPKLPPRQRRGALILAGYIADPALASSVQEAWRLTAEDRDLEVFLWAAARVCGDEAEAMLGPVCDAWETLSDAEDEHGISKRNSLSAHGVAWKFRDHVPKSALPYFVERARRSEALRWPITYMLKGVDDPVSLQHEVEYLAQRSREAGGGGIFDYFLKGEWQRLGEEQGRRMSIESKQRLLDISADQSNDVHLRKQAFSLWEVSLGPGDVDVARAIDQGDVRYDKAVWARARRNDLTVVPQLLEKIVENPSYWWQAGRYIWTEDLTQALSKTIREVAAATITEQESKGSWILPELILKLDAETGENLLLPVWNEIRHIPTLLQVALCLATPKLVELVRIEVADAPDPQALFKHFSFTVGIRTQGRKGIVQLLQLQALQPYFQLLSDVDLVEVWEVCVKHGWLDYAREHLEPILRSHDSDYVERVLGRTAVSISDLESNLNERRHLMAYHWFEGGMRRGATRKELIAALFDWFNSKKSLPALEIVGIVLSQEGNRSEFAQLKEVVLDMPDNNELLDAIQFDIFRRTLI